MFNPKKCTQLRGFALVRANQGKRSPGPSIASCTSLALLIVLGALAQNGQTPGNRPGIEKVSIPEPVSQTSDASLQSASRFAVPAPAAGAPSSRPMNASHKEIFDESSELLNLALALKTDVDKTNKDMLSVSVIRKAEQIEKLAHTVKEKMKLNARKG